MKSILLTLCAAFWMHDREVQANEPIRPLPQEINQDQKLVRLGARLFQDKRLSRDQNQSCATCHDLGRGGIEGPDAPAPSPDSFNVPTIFNVGFHFKYLWTGRANSLEEQIEITVTSPKVFHNDWPTIIHRLEGDPQYRAFELNPYLIKKAIAAYEMSLITPNARFDQYLRGDSRAISAEEKEGYQLFKDLGCSSCHQGMLLGGNMFQKFGIFRQPDPKADRDRLSRDLGRFAVTQKEEDKFIFKVPSLRNVELTAPYFHNGAAPTLEKAVAAMGRYQLGRELSPREIERIIQFLKTLTGPWQGHKPP